MENIEVTAMDKAKSDALLKQLLAGEMPDAQGRFGPYGGSYIPETLVPAFQRLTAAVKEILPSADFQRELADELRDWVGRPTALSPMRNLSKRWGVEVWFKREDLAHTGAHKINNALGQALLARRMGAKRIVAETGAGQHGVATAAACARLGLPCTVYMGEVDMERQAPNVGRMRLMGATVVPVTSGDRTLRAAIDEAFRDWVSDPTNTFYILGSAVGPHPYPYLVRELQAIIGREARAQMLERTGHLPDCVIACVGGGSNAIGTFHAFLGDSSVEIIGVEAGGRGAGLGDNAATLATGRPGVLHGTYTMLLQDADGQIQETHSVSAGLDYPGVGPEHALLGDIGRVKYIMALDDDALACVEECSTYEGLLPAIESAHALSGARDWAKRNPGKCVLVGLSGRGDKDMPTLQKTLLAKLAGAAK
ncbi:MAG TPA: tryptophan synthase subunit beta [Steroidobacteraceae bacterium]|nr:tryptophan synthase subunit beta [Steroidobacteraceae bacterium]